MACLHGGVFTRAQWTDFLGCHHEKVRRAVHRLAAHGVAVEENPPGGIAGIGRICRIHGRRIYRALGAGDRRRRRIAAAGSKWWPSSGHRRRGAGLETVLGNWARDPHPSEIDDETGREIARIE